ncbi:MAG TPA: DUF559 domain-containing protein [Candidatus Dormibacteraeota bacterium]|nr:DUF559 domain-containing protein [Candidatus Dormibacteraeota bacterium]
MLQLMARRETLPRDALFAGRSAGWLHGMDMAACNPIEINMPRASQTSHLAGVRLFRSDVSRGETCEVRGLPATSRVRTVADLGRRLPLVEAVVVLDMALHRRLVEIEDLRLWTHQHPRYWGVAGLRRACAFAERKAESPMETRLRMLLLLNGLPKPDVQPELQDETGLSIARADLYYASHRLVIEYDGATHQTSVAADNRRQNRLLEAGYNSSASPRSTSGECRQA